MTSSIPARLALLVALAYLAQPALAADAIAPAPASSATGPCRAVRLPDRGPLKAERDRIAKTDAELRKRNDALQLRGGTLDVTDLAAVDAYNRDVAALEADSAANDHAWDGYEEKLAKANRQSRDAVRCGRLATGAVPARAASAGASAAR